MNNSSCRINNSAIFGPIGLNIFTETQEIIIYWSVMRNPSCDAYFSFLFFWATFGGKMGLANTHAPNGLGPPDPTKTSAHGVDLLGQPLSWNHDFEIFKGNPPP